MRVQENIFRRYPPSPNLNIFVCKHTKKKHRIHDLISVSVLVADPYSDPYASDLSVQSDGTVLCKICGGKYSTRTNANRHFREKHMGFQRKPDPCDVCGRSFNSTRVKADHMRMVHRIFARDLKHDPLMQNVHQKK